MSDLVAIISKKVGISPNIVRSIIQLLDHPQQARAMAEHAYAEVIAEYDVERMARRYLNVYASVLSRR